MAFPDTNRRKGLAMSILMSLFLLQAATAAAPATTEVAVTSPDDARIVCKTLRETGSRLAGKRVCASKREWRRLNEEAEKAAREVQDTHSQRPGNQ
jgi:hypothetical protein